MSNRQAIKGNKHVKNMTADYMMSESDAIIILNTT